MNKQEVIDYVMSTPHNVNRTILSQSLDEIGTQADWNQNDPTKPDYIKNKPEVGGGGSIITVSFVDHYDNEADESHFVCPLTFEEVGALTTSKTPKPVFFSVADSESSDWGYVTMTAELVKHNGKPYIYLAIYRYTDILYFAFSESGEALSGSFSFTEDLETSKLERWGTVSWGASE